MKVQDLINESLLTINVTGAGNQTPTTLQSSIAFNALMGLLDTSNADPLRVLTAARVAFLLQRGKQAYTIGDDPSRDIPVPRPAKIIRANLYDQTAANPPHYSVSVMEWTDYESSSIRNTPTPQPFGIWYDRGYSGIAGPTDPTPPPATNPAVGYGTIYTVGIPNEVQTMEIWIPHALTLANAATDELVFPSGYYEYLLYGLCVRLYPRFGRQTDPTIAQLYQDARIVIESANVVPAVPMQLGSRGYWDGRSNRFIV